MARISSSPQATVTANDPELLLERFARDPNSSGRQALLEQIVAEYITLADALARRYAHRGIELDDLKQVARLALVKAAHRYRPGSSGFPAFAVPTITGELKRHFRDHGWMVRPPRRLQELRVVVSQHDSIESARAGQSSRDSSDLVGISDAELAEVRSLTWSYRPQSLDAARSNGDKVTLGDGLGGTDRRLEELPALLTLRAAVARLSQRDRTIVRWRFVEECTQAEIGDRLGISQMQVSRILTRILSRLRDEFVDEVLAS